MAELGHVDSAQSGGTRHFRLSGEFDLSNAWQIEDALLDAISHDDRDIVVDLTAVGFMDAQLVRAIVNARGVAVKQGIAFTVLPPANPTAGRVAELIDFEAAA